MSIGSEVLKLYIYITCAGYGMMEVHRYAGFCMTGTNQPFKASLLIFFALWRSWFRCH
jgi:hypothetical protein